MPKARAAAMRALQLDDTLGEAHASLGLGEKDPAFAWIEKAYEQRQFRISWLKVEPRWDTIRGDPRFASLLRRIGTAP